MLVRILLLSLVHILLLVQAAASSTGPQPFLVLCYHSVQQVAETPYTTSFSRFAQQMDYLANHGYHPVSLNDIRKAAAGEIELPDKAILLTFDDGYRSYREFILPVLKQYGYPSVLAIVGRWIESPPEDLPEPLLGWDELRHLTREPLVELVSHSYDLHRAVQYTPQGNVGSVVSVRRYLPASGRYATEAEYRALLADDFARQRRLFKRQLGMVPSAVVWPYGRFNAIAIEEAEKAGCSICLTLEEGYASTDQLNRIRRITIADEPMEEFATRLTRPTGTPPLIRAMQVDLDLIYDPDSEAQTDRNLGRLIDRIIALGVNTVFLQAFADPDGDGAAEAVYFPNRLLPVRADILGHAVHQMIIRDLRVYAWMPLLSYILPDRQKSRRLGVKQLTETGQRVPSEEHPLRLSPFSREVQQAVRTLYTDLAAHCQISGILFQDDGFLRDSEDFHDEASKFNSDYLPSGITREALLSGRPDTWDWIRAKSRFLVNFTDLLREAVARYRPRAQFARNIFARPLLQPESERWFAQNFQLFLKSYDQVVLMAYPQMERTEEPVSWLERLVHQVKRYPLGPAKTIFKIQTYDWQEQQWLDNDLLLRELRTILRLGGRHLGYYPDNLWANRPEIQALKPEMSTIDFPRQTPEP